MNLLENPIVLDAEWLDDVLRCKMFPHFQCENEPVWMAQVCCSGDTPCCDECRELHRGLLTTHTGRCLVCLRRCGWEDIKWKRI